jgi:nucleoside-diphosphate-sugar epimerase
MRVLVTGGAGFIGSHVVNHFVKHNYDVIVMDNFSTGSMDNLPKEIEPIVIHTIGGGDPLPVGLKFDTLIHLGAPVSVSESFEDPAKYFDQIAYGTNQLMKWAVDCGCKNFVLASTAAVYGGNKNLPLDEDDKPYPESPYATSKLLMEYMAEAFTDKSVAILRFFNVYGEGQRDEGGYLSAIPIFLKQYNNNEPLTVTGDGKQTRDFVYVGDLVQAIENSISFNGVLNIGSGEEISIIDIANTFKDDIKFIPKRKEPKRSLADIYNAYFWISWKPKTSLKEWIKSKL